MDIKSLKEISLNVMEPPEGAAPGLVHCKGGGSPPIPEPPPAYEPPTPPPAYEPLPDPTEAEKAAALEKQKKAVELKVSPRGKTILTGLLTEKPDTSKPQLKKKLGA